MAQDDSKYTDPEMRKEIKEDIQEGDKGGEPGQWTARKAQLTAKEYENQGGEYTTEKKDESQQNLTNWGDKENQAADQSKQEESGEKPAEKEAASDEQAEKKETEAASEEKQAEPAAEESEVPADEPMKDEAAPTDQQLEDEDLEDDQDEPEEEQSDYEDGSDGEPPKKSRKTNGEASAGTRKTPQRARKPPQDKPAAKTAAEPSEHGQPGSTDRLPEQGQKVHWKSGASMTEGEVVEVLKSETMLGKRKYKASESDPRLKVKSSSSGKEAVHKPEALFF